MSYMNRYGNAQIRLGRADSLSINWNFRFYHDPKRLKGFIFRLLKVEPQVMELQK